MSGTLVTATVGNTARTLGDWTSDAIFIEGFGAKGDGSTDDSAALLDAIASGKPVRFGPNTYIVNSNISITSNVTLIGVPGESIVRRTSETVSAPWFNIGASGTEGASVTVDGITFDANSSLTGFDSQTILVGPYCTSSYWNRCRFINNQGLTVGHGLEIGNSPATGTQTEHVVTNCDAVGNCIGIYGQALDGFQVLSCRAYNNRNAGIAFSYYDSSKELKGRYAQIIGNRCWNNVDGINVGDFQDGSGYGPANPDTLFCIIAENQCYNNQQYGIVAQGQYLQVSGNTCTSNADALHDYGGGILANSSNSQIIGNTVVGFNPPTNPPYGYGIDAGGSVNIVISSNNISSYSYGIDVGGCQDSFVSGNYIYNCMGQGIFVDVVEVSEAGDCFPNPTGNIIISENTINIPVVSGSTFYGILINNGAQGVAINNNKFLLSSGDGSCCLLARTNNYTVTGNLYNGDIIVPSHYSPSTIHGYETLRYLDIADTVQLNDVASIASLLSMNAVTYYEQVTFVIVNDGGSGYTSPPTVNFSGGGGSGAAAMAILYEGVVKGIRMFNFGSGYSSAPTITFSEGGGTGATATAYKGLTPPSRRLLKIISLEALTFEYADTNPKQYNYTGAAITIPPNTSIDWYYQTQAWLALSFMT